MLDDDRDRSAVDHVAEVGPRALLYNGVTAVAEFPDEAFHRPLIETFGRIRRAKSESTGGFRKACIALAKFQRREVASLFRGALAERDRHRRSAVRQAITVALRLAPHSYYDELERAIELNELEARSIEGDMEYETGSAPTRMRK